MSAVQQALPGVALPDPIAEAEAAWRAALAAHLPLCRDPRCMTDEEHWKRTSEAQRAMERAYRHWQRLLRGASDDGNTHDDG